MKVTSSSRIGRLKYLSTTSSSSFDRCSCFSFIHVKKLPHFLLYHRHHHHDHHISLFSSVCPLFLRSQRLVMPSFTCYYAKDRFVFFRKNYVSNATKIAQFLFCTADIRSLFGSLSDTPCKCTVT